MTQYKTKKPKGTPFTHKGATIIWFGVRVAKAEYKGLNLEIRSNTCSRSLYIDGRRVHSDETIKALKEFACEYLGK